MSARKFLALLMALSAFFLSTKLQAASTTFNAIFFKPATGSNAYFMLQSTDTLHQYQFNAGFYQSYAYRPLQLSDGSTRIRGVIDNLSLTDFVVAFSPLEFLQIGVDFPLIEINKFKSPYDSTTAPLANHFSIGDVRAEIKARVLDPQKYRIGLAIIPFITAPTGRDAYYVGDPGITGGGRIAVDGRIARKFLATLNVGFQTGKKVEVRNVSFQNRFLLGGGLAGFFGKGFSAFAEADASTSINNFFSDKDSNPAEVMAGVKWDVAKTGLTVSAGGGTCIVCGMTGAKIQGVLGVAYRFNTPKYQQLDQDVAAQYDKLFNVNTTESEIYNLRMNCPDNPAEFVEGVNDVGCPKYYELRQVADLVLRCPQKQEDFNASVHDAACPKVFELSSNYSSDDVRAIYDLSVVELEIRCPTDPANFNPQIHDVSCPKYYSLKEAVDLAAQCPSKASSYKAGIDDPSCPKLYELQSGYADDQWASMIMLAKKDTDSDGVNDYLDRCPTVPDNRAGASKGNGCPEGEDGMAFGGEIRTVDPVYFDFNSAIISDKTIAGIKEAVRIINKTKWVYDVRVEGYADAIGTPEANIKISKARADAVVRYMKALYIRPNVRIATVPLGASAFVAPNTTESGRALNRRVTFHVIGQGPKPKVEKSKPRPAPAAKVADDSTAQLAPAAPPAETPTAKKRTNKFSK